MKFDQQDFNNWMRGAELSPRTIKEYNSYLRKFVFLERLNQESVRHFLHMNHNLVARSFVKNVLDYLKENPHKIEEGGHSKEEIGMIVRQKIRGRKAKKIPRVFTPEEVVDILNKIKRKDVQLMFRLTYEGGLRRSELFLIRFKDIKDNEIIIRGKGNKERSIPYSPEIMDELRDYLRLQERRGKLDLNGDKSIWNMKYDCFRKLIGKASFEAIGRPVNLHLIRHSKTTHLSNKNVNIVVIKDFLGHDDISTTQMYIHLDPKALQNLPSTVTVLSNTNDQPHSENKEQSQELEDNVDMAKEDSPIAENEAKKPASEPSSPQEGNPPISGNTLPEPLK